MKCNKKNFPFCDTPSKGTSHTTQKIVLEEVSLLFKYFFNFQLTRPKDILSQAISFCLKGIIATIFNEILQQKK